MCPVLCGCGHWSPRVSRACPVHTMPALLGPATSEAAMLPGKGGEESHAQSCVLPLLFPALGGNPRMTEISGSPPGWTTFGSPTCQHRAQAFPRHHSVESSSVFQERTLRAMAKLS